MRVSAVILTKNEENIIRKCIKQLRFCDEVILIDDYSTDKTVSVGRSLGCRVYKRHLRNDFSSQRNFGLSKAKNSWVLFVDADESVSELLAEEIMNVTLGPTFNAYRIVRHEVFKGKELYFGGWTDSHIRLGNKENGSWERTVHERWVVKGSVGQLMNPMLHDSHSCIREFLTSVNTYSRLHALANEKEGKYSSLTKIIVWPLGKFIYNFFLKKGYRDGIEGFIYALMMSLHSFLSWSKLWLYQKNTKKL